VERPACHVECTEQCLVQADRSVPTGPCSRAQRLYNRVVADQTTWPKRHKKGPLGNELNVEQVKLLLENTRDAGIQSVEVS
jgi:hypothetical protein